MDSTGSNQKSSRSAKRKKKLKEKEEKEADNKKCPANKDKN